MSDKISIALIGESYADLQEVLETEFEVTSLAEAGSHTRGVVAPASLGFSPELLEPLTNLEIITVFGVGLDKIDLRYALRRELVVAATQGAHDDTVAEHALALLLAASRQICQADSFVRDGEWPHSHFPISFGLAGRRCGILGLGRIGRKIARLCQAFGATVGYHGRRRQDDVEYHYYDDLWSLANESDVLILALPGGPETEGIVDSTILSALGPEGVLVNIARGSVVDEEALIEALEYGDLAAAALDVFPHEPHVSEALRALHNVVLSPHMASSTFHARQAMSVMTRENLRAHFAGLPVPGKVSNIAP